MSTPPYWLGTDGEVIACIEKIKVLDENYIELKQLSQDLFDDALLLGCNEQTLRTLLHELVDSLSGSFER